MRMRKWKFTYTLINGTLQLAGWETPLSVRKALKRLREEWSGWEWRSRKEIVQNQQIHFIESRIKFGFSKEVE